MPRLNRPPAFFYVISLLALTVGVLGLGLSYTTAAALRRDSTLTTLPPAVSDTQSPSEPTPNDAPSQSTPGGSPSDAAPSDEHDAPSEQEIAVSLPAPAYTVRLIPSEDALASASLAIFDAQGATVEQRALVLACLCPDDRSALAAGIEAEDLGAARALLADFCE